MASAINTSEPALLNLTGALFNISEGLILEYDLTLSNTSGNGSEVGANDYEFVYTMKDSERQILGLITGAMGMVTIPWLFGVTLTEAYRKLSYTVYLSAMSVYDLLFVLLVFVDSGIKRWRDWQIRDVLVWEVPCRLYDHFVYTCSVISIWLNVALAVDRYIVIAFPFKRDTFCTRKNSWILTGGIIAVVHCLGIAYLIVGKVNYIPVFKRDYCQGKRIALDFDAYMEQVAGILPAVLFIVVINALSVVQLSRHAAKRRKMVQSNQSEGTATRTSKATYALVAIGICTVIGQLPNAFNELLLTYTKEHQKELHNKLNSAEFPVYAKAVEVFQSLKLLTHIQNFFILFFMNGDFRRGAAKLVMRKKRQIKP
ncbi:hypothetical protein RRG08_044632 [Elysia crispata]|uniref:G-protein coupled receptors family 1 profile domain-containing protein n=1 Tax=Elysia crispata TaxID=231223 RepID=A0AAE1D1Q4_9GAST|nr:hypothetical protein RRG08_044632 [Elysia crispata]